MFVIKRGWHAVTEEIKPTEGTNNHVSVGTQNNASRVCNQERLARSD